jgi:hypothetical protein
VVLPADSWADLPPGPKEALAPPAPGVEVRAAPAARRAWRTWCGADGRWCKATASAAEPWRTGSGSRGFGQAGGAASAAVGAACGTAMWRWRAVVSQPMRPRPKPTLAAAGGVRRLPGAARRAARGPDVPRGLSPIVTLEKQPLHMIGNLV